MFAFIPTSDITLAESNGSVILRRAMIMIILMELSSFGKFAFLFPVVHIKVRIRYRKGIIGNKRKKGRKDCKNVLAITCKLMSCQ